MNFNKFFLQFFLLETGIDDLSVYHHFEIRCSKKIKTVTFLVFIINLDQSVTLSPIIYGPPNKAAKKTEIVMDIFLSLLSICVRKSNVKRLFLLKKY